ncbi:MAG: eukaryotic-like serine/threonine-protein kinase, partial [Verrucomicrobiota bacterium]
MFGPMPPSSSETIEALAVHPGADGLPPGVRYWAFVSYSHRDEAWAKWVHEGIETYRIPRSLVGQPLHGGRTPHRLFPLFRDREELPGAAELKTQIQQALESSLYLIVICSPRAAVSRWVNREIEVFKLLGGEGRVLCLIVDGEPNADSNLGALECFPPAVRFKVAPNGDLTSEATEPIAADARPGKDGKPNALLKLLS